MASSNNRSEQEALSENLEFFSPGVMLRQARKNMGFTQQEVAKKLNFRLALVRDIEANKFDSSLPETFTRGYLRNYAKLVNVTADEILSSYESLTVPDKKASRMQSFSRITHKQAQNNWLMLGSYLIIFLLMVSTFVWWMQDSKNSQTTPSELSLEVNEKDNKQNPFDNPNEVQTNPSEIVNAEEEKSAISTTEVLPNTTEFLSDSPSVNNVSVGAEQNKTTSADNVTSLANIETTIIFKFSGDCWVNIYDATGERVAWGIKKTGYTMTISGQAPFNVTVGRPELTEISYNGESVDMSQFGAGNIAKFTLPL